MTNQLADRYAALKIEMDALQDELDQVKAQILATGSDLIEGDRFKVTVGLQERTSISAKEAEKILDPTVYAVLAKTTMFPAVRYKAIKA